MKSLDELAGQQAAAPIPVAVVKAADPHVLDSVVRAALEGRIRPVLIDDAARVEELLAGRLAQGSYRIVDESDEVLAAREGVALVTSGEARVLMKGHLPSGTFLKPVVNRESGIRLSPVLSHVALIEHAGIGRCIAVTDGGMVTTATAENLDALVAHGVATLRRLGSEQPKVALLSAAEQVIPRLASAELQHDWVAAHTGDVVVEGPLSVDIALVPRIAAEKGWRGRIQGDAEVLVCPDIVSANVLAKSLVLFGGGRMAGVVLGARVPIVLVSRASSADEKYFSLLLASTLGAAAPGNPVADGPVAGATVAGDPVAEDVVAGER